MQSSTGKQCFELDLLQVDFLLFQWGFFGHASFGKGLLVGFFCFEFVLSLVFFFPLIAYATEVQNMFPLQWCLDGTLYYEAHYSCDTTWVSEDKPCPFKIVVFGELIHLLTLIFYKALGLGITKHFWCFLINLLLLVTFFCFCWSLCSKNYCKKTVWININPHWTGNLPGH